jgi:hypothetical protein
VVVVVVVVVVVGLALLLLLLQRSLFDLLSLKCRTISRLLDTMY